MAVTAAARKPKTPPEPMTVTAFARWKGVSPKAVRQRIAAGALPKSVKRVKGRRMVVDAELAVTEWEAHTRPRVSETAPPKNGTSPAKDLPPSALSRSTTREREARAKLAELDYERRSGTLVRAADVERRWAARVVAARTKLLGLSSRVQQRLAHLTLADLAVIDVLVREALEELGNEPEPKGD